MDELYFYKVMSFRVIDGDTIEATIDLGYHTSMNLKYRLDRFDAPETFRPVTEAERQGGMKVSAKLTQLLLENQGNLYLKSKKSADVYARWSAELFYEVSGVLININDIMMKFIEDNHLTKEELRKVA